MINIAKKEANDLNNKKINLKITTPRGLKFVEKADKIVMCCIDGDLGVLPGHAPVSTVLADGILRIINDGIEKKLAVFGGVAEINDTKVNIFSTIAQQPDEIDLERAKKDREEAEAAIQEESEEMQFQKASVLIRHSLLRIEVSQHLDEIMDYDDYDDEEDEEE